MVGRNLWINLQRVTLWLSVFVLNAVLFDCQSTCSKIFLAHPVLSRIYLVSGGPYISLVIWVLSLLLFVMPLETKEALTIYGRIGVCVSLCVLSGWM